MGLFSKKTYVCSKCGKEYQKRINLSGNVCDECFQKEWDEKQKLLKKVGGYDNYAKDVLGKYDGYSSDELKKILEHKDAICEKYKNPESISRDDIAYAGENYKKLSQEEIRNIFIYMSNSTVDITMGAGYRVGFFVPTDYQGVIIDAEDVFAVGYTRDSRQDVSGSEVILCALFTNDPYIPVFPMIYVGKLGFFEVAKSRKGREGVKGLMEDLCPSLTYEVQDLKSLKKLIKQEDRVRGNIQQKFMIDKIDYAIGGIGIFNTKKMGGHLLNDTVEMLDNMGYMTIEDIQHLLKMDKAFNRSFWEKQIKSLLKE